MRAFALTTALAAVSLAGCENADRVTGLCKPFPTAAASQPADGDGSIVLEDCLHRWGYALAGAKDDAGFVAEAVVAACTAPLVRWNQASLTADSASAEAPSLLTGEPTNPIAQHAAFAEDRALFYVVQARAGGCKAPPRREGAPAMTGPDA